MKIWDVETRVSLLIRRQTEIFVKAQVNKVNNHELESKKQFC